MGVFQVAHLALPDHVAGGGRRHPALHPQFPELVEVEKEDVVRVGEQLVAHQQRGHVHQQGAQPVTDGEAQPAGAPRQPQQALIQVRRNLFVQCRRPRRRAQALELRRLVAQRGVHRVRPGAQAAGLERAPVAGQHRPQGGHFHLAEQQRQRGRLALAKQVVGQRQIGQRALLGGQTLADTVQFHQAAPQAFAVPVRRPPALEPPADHRQFAALPPMLQPPGRFAGARVAGHAFQRLPGGRHLGRRAGMVLAQAAEKFAVGVEVALLAAVGFDPREIVPAVLLNQASPEMGLQPAPGQGVPERGQRLVEQGRGGAAGPDFLGHRQRAHRQGLQQPQPLAVVDPFAGLGPFETPFELLAKRQQLGRGHRLIQGHRVAVGAIHQAPVLIENQALPFGAAFGHAFHHHVRQILTQRVAGEQHPGGTLAGQRLHHHLLGGRVAAEHRGQGRRQGFVGIQVEQALALGLRVHGPLVQHPVTLAVEHARQGAQPAHQAVGVLLQHGLAGNTPARRHRQAGSQPALHVLVAALVGGQYIYAHEYLIIRVGRGAGARSARDRHGRTTA